MVIDERQLTTQLVTNERADDREAGAVGCGLHAVAVVGDHEHDIAAVPR